MNTIQMNERCYVLPLWDYALPAFVSGDTPYAGTLDMIEHFISKGYKQEKDSNDTFHMLDAAFRRYKEGYHDATISIAYRDMQMLTPAEYMWSYSGQTAPFKYDHTNIWGYPYYFTAEQVDYTLYYLRVKDAYIRYLQAAFTRLQYSIDETEKKDDITMTLGQPYLLNFSEDGCISNRLLIPEKRFDGENEARADMKEPSPIDYGAFMNEILGDG